MFTGVWKPNKDDNDNYFIDRDGLYFNHILIIKSLNKIDKKALLIEANYYRIDELISLLYAEIYEGDELINMRVKIYWEDKKWYKGVVYRYNKLNDKHSIRYDDGVENRIN